jgi:hypothetical protein
VTNEGDAILPPVNYCFDEWFLRVYKSWGAAMVSIPRFLEGKSNCHLTTMPSILQEIADLLECRVNQISEKITHPDAREKVKNLLLGRYFNPTYQRENRVMVRCDDLSLGDATRTHAYEGLYNITVQQHFYVKKRIHLMYPRLPLIEMKVGRNKASSIYYPMELLSAVPPSSEDLQRYKATIKEDHNSKSSLDLDLHLSKLGGLW